MTIKYFSASNHHQSSPGFPLKASLFPWSHPADPKHKYLKNSMIWIQNELFRSTLTFTLFFYLSIDWLGGLSVLLNVKQLPRSYTGLTYFKDETNTAKLKNINFVNCLKWFNFYSPTFMHHICRNVWSMNHLFVLVLQRSVRLRLDW